jgi:hypothetical protein
MAKMTLFRVILFLRDSLFLNRYDMYSVITNQKIVGFFKTSRYFKTNLGLVNTIEKNGERVYNQRDGFAYFYNNQYKTTIYGQGNIGDIMFYLDYYIHKDVIAVYLNNDEFVFEFDPIMAKEKGPEFYLGHLLKSVDQQHEDRKKEEEEKKAAQELKPEGSPDKLVINPGAVTYADLQAYLQKKQAERYLVKELPKKE